MATSITHEDVKPRIGIPSATTTFDTEIDTICTAVAAGCDSAVASAFLTSNAAYVKEAAIMIASGTAALSMAKRPGWGEAVTAGGLALGALGTDGAETMIKVGWEMLKPYSASGNADELAKTAEASLRKLLAEARDDDCAAQADAELLKAQNEAAKLGSEKLLADSQKSKTDSEKLKIDAETTTEASSKAKIDAEKLKVDAEKAKITAETTTEGSVKLKTDAETAKLTAEELLTDAQTATEAQKPVKVLADAAMSTAMAADAQKRADLNAARLARMTAEDTAMADVTELPLESHSGPDDNLFALDSQEYDL